MRRLSYRAGIAAGLAAALCAPGRASGDDGPAGTPPAPAGAVPAPPPAGAVPAPVRVDAFHGKATVQGRVLDAEGKPAAGARVLVWGWPDLLAANGSLEFGRLSPPPVPRGTASTDGDGRFAVTGLVRGVSVVRVEVPRGEGRSDAVGGTIVTAVEEGAPPLGIRMAAAPVTLRGVVVDDDGSPVAGAPVVAGVDDLYPAPVAVLAQAMSTVRTTTGATGAFEVAVARDPGYFVAARRPRDGRWVMQRRTPTSVLAAPLRLAFAGGADFAASVVGQSTRRPVANAEVIVVSAPADPAGTWFLQTPAGGASGAIALPRFPPLGQGGVAVRAPEIGADWNDAASLADGAIEVRRGTTLSGHVRDARGAPVVGASVCALSFSWPLRSALTDEAGAYRIEGLPRTRPWYPDPDHQANGGLQVWVEAPGFSAQPASALLATRGEAVQQDFTLRAGATVRGRVEGTDPVDVVRWAPGDFAPYQDMLELRGTAVGEDGTFVLVDLPPGRITLKASETRKVVVDGVAEGEVREVRLPPAPR